MSDPQSTGLAGAPLDYSSLATFLGAAAEWIEAALPDYLPSQEPREYLYDLVREYPARGGKRFRSALMLLACAAVGGDPARALPSAVALELFHNFALVHDDIEDSSLLRRGLPTLHRMHGVPLALNAGDTLFALVYEALQANEEPLGSEAASRVRREFQALIRRTLEGQALDIGWAAADRLPGREEYHTMIRHKTAWYSGIGPCRVGAIVGGADSATVERFGEFGEALGLGFQIRDDLLNLAPDSSGEAPRSLSGGYGKERGGDIAEGKRTLIVTELLERLPGDEVERLKAILRRPAAQTAAEDIDWAIACAERTGALAAVDGYCETLAQRARRLLEPLPPSRQRDLLAELVGYLVSDREA